MHELTALICVVAACALLASCGFVGGTVGYKRIQESPIYVSEGQLRTFVTEGRTQDEVIAALGLPDARNEETGALGFVRCVDSEGRDVGVLVVVYPVFPVVTGKDAVRDCEIVAVWFDANGRAVSTKRREAFYKWGSSDPTPNAIVYRMLGIAHSYDIFSLLLTPEDAWAASSTPRTSAQAAQSGAGNGDFYPLYAWMYAKGVKLSVGQGVPPDHLEAYKWFSIVAANSTDFYLTSQATKALSYLELRLDAAQIAEGERRARAWIEESEKSQQSQSSNVEGPPSG